MSDDIDRKIESKKEGAAPVEQELDDSDSPVLDMAQAEATLFYQDAPINGPAWFKDAAQAKSTFAQRVPGTSEWTIGNGVGSLGQLTPDELAKKKSEDAAEEFAETMIEVGEKQREVEREREEWSRSKHSYAGMEMSGEEWSEFADKLKGDTPLRKWLLEKLKKEGKSDAKANEMADQMSLLAKMQSLPPNQWSPEMKALDAKLDADPALKQDLDKRLKEAHNFDNTLEVDGQKVGQTAALANSDMVNSTLNGADILALPSETLGPALPQKLTSHAANVGDSKIETALDLGEHHRAALEAKTPLDAPKVVASYVPSTPPTPVSPGAGFDV